MARLILVRHSVPELVPDVPAHRWGLAELGRERCGALADRLSAYEPAVIVSSTERKAQETAELTGRLLGRPVTVAEGRTCPLVWC